VTPAEASRSGEEEDSWAALSASPLALAGGWHVAPLLTLRARAALLKEALRSHAGATVSHLERSPDEDTRRGNPARRLESAPGGPRLQALYSSPGLRRVVQRLTGLAWVPSGGQASFSYYREPGHFLGVHRDVDECDLAVIACLYDQGAPPGGRSGVLSLWPTRTDEAVSGIRREPDFGRVAVRLSPGQAIVLLGGVVAHGLDAVAPGHARIVSPLCFTLSALNRKSCPHH
jgi:hypothetical protein